MAGKVLVVTGANKGIGFYIVKLLLQEKLNDRDVVYLTARDIQRGEDAVKELTRDENKNLKFHQLDISKIESIRAFAAHLKENHGGIDLLVNNAAMAYKKASTAPFAEQAEVTLGVNYFDNLNVCNEFFPLLKQNARVVHVSSMAGYMTWPKLSGTLKEKFSSKDLTLTGLKELLTQFIQAAKDGNVEEAGYPMTAYGMSKIGVTLMTQIQQRELGSNEKNILINSICPGFCDTDMTSHNGPRPAEVGASVAVYVATSTNIKDGGKFYEKIDPSDIKVTPFPPS